MKQLLIIEDIYNSYVEVFRQRLVPKHILQTSFILPFYLGMPDDTILAGLSGLGKHGFIFGFKRVEEKISYDTKGLILTSLPEEIVQNRTYVEAVYVRQESIDYETQGDGIFSSLLKDLNKMLSSYSLFRFETDVRSVTNQMLKPFSFVRVFAVDNWASDEFIPVLYNSNLQEIYNEIDETEGKKFIDYAFRTFSTQGPMLDSESFGMDALRHYKNGLRKEAVVSIQTSIESFLSSLYIILLLSEGIEYDDVIVKLEKIAFKNLVEHQFHNRIGGNWAVNDDTKECGKWWKYTYMMRNKIVHEGELPTFVQTNDAIKYAVEFKEYVIQLVLEHTSNSYDNAKKLFLSLYLNDNETFVGKLFRNDISYDLVRNNGKLVALSEEIQRSVENGLNGFNSAT